MPLTHSAAVNRTREHTTGVTHDERTGHALVSLGGVPALKVRARIWP